MPDLPADGPQDAPVPDAPGDLDAAAGPEAASDLAAQPAAAHERRRAVRAARQRGRAFLAALVKPTRTQGILAAVLFVCGLGVTMQLQSQAGDDGLRSLRRDELVAMLDDLTAQSRSLDAEIGQLEETRRQLQTGADADQVAREAAQKRLDTLEVLGGTVAATGPGVRIVIHDPQRKVTPEILINCIEELRDAGAEVMEVNDRIRLVASSWVSSGAGGLVVDNQAVQQPIVLDVIGDPQTLAEASRFRGGLISTVEGSQVGGRVELTSVDQVRIDAVVTPRAPRFARPA